VLLVDSHCHLNYPQFTDIEAFIDNARKHNVGILQTISTKESDFAEIIQLSENHSIIYHSIGIHPHEADKHLHLTTENLLEWLKHEKATSIGETGLDYYYEHSDREAQKTLFIRHIQAAQQCKKVVIVHTRDAEEDTIKIIKQQLAIAPFNFLIHCFTGTKWLAEQVLSLGGYISISGIITFKKSDALREVVKDIPLDRLLVETDSPYLAPEPYRGKENQPAYTSYVAAKLSELKGVGIEELANTTSNNYSKLFGVKI
jgi:TatD DNase family protein